MAFTLLYQQLGKAGPPPAGADSAYRRFLNHDFFTTVGRFIQWQSCKPGAAAQLFR